jgi:uncharacterized membrane protein YphA (DoxX/SURF4 family)
MRLERVKMKTLSWIALAFLVLLSVSTGITKLVQLPAEMELFHGAGFGDTLTLAFGGIQLAGGLLLIFPASRRVGAWVMVITFAIASWVVWTSGMVGFFFVSLTFILLATLPLWPRVRLPGAVTAEE